VGRKEKLEMQENEKGIKKAGEGMERVGGIE